MSVTELNKKNDGKVSVVDDEKAKFFYVCDAKNPFWTNSDKKSITLDVLFKGYEDTLGYMPFTADPNDIEAHGRLLYANALAGDYGIVQEPPGMTEGQAINEVALCTSRATSRINSLTTKIETIQDAIDMDIAEEGDLKTKEELESNLKAWKKYRVLLSRVDTSKAPDVVFPASPEE